MPLFFRSRINYLSDLSFHRSMADLSRELAAAIKGFLHRGEGRIVYEKKVQLTMLACGLHESLLLFEGMRDFAGSAFPLTRRCLLLSASTASQFVGAVSLRDYTFMQHHNVESADPEAFSRDFEQLKIELKRWSNAMAQWMLNANAEEHHAHQLLIDSSLANLGPLLASIDSEVLATLTFAVNDIRPALRQLQASCNNVQNIFFDGSTSGSMQ